MNLDDLPPGYRFCPLDWELLVFYLEKKVKNEPLPPNKILDVNLYQFTPDQLEVLYSERRERNMYFFTQRDRKYLKGSRPNRVTGPVPGSTSGYWKASNGDKEVQFNGEVVGFKKTLVFQRRTDPEDVTNQKTNWIMNEYRLDNVPPPSKKDDNDMKLDWVLCSIHKNGREEPEHPILNGQYDNPTTEIARPICLMSLGGGESSAGRAYSNVNAFPENTQLPLQNNLAEHHAYGSAANSMQYYYNLSQTEALEPVASHDERPTQAHSSADGMHNNQPLQNAVLEIPEWNNNTSGNDAEFPAFDAYNGTSMEFVEPLNVLLPPSNDPLWVSTFTGFEDDIWNSTYQEN